MCALNITRYASDSYFCGAVHAQLYTGLTIMLQRVTTSI